MNSYFSWLSVLLLVVLAAMLGIVRILPKGPVMLAVRAVVVAAIVLLLAIVVWNVVVAWRR